MEHKLFHITNWKEAAQAKVGETFTLHCGQQNAEGLGVYFSQDQIVPCSTAEGSFLSAPQAVVQIGVSTGNGWWRTKNSLCKKFKRPRTWHTKGKHIRCCVQDIKHTAIDGHNGLLPLVICSWEFV